MQFKNDLNSKVKGYQCFSLKILFLPSFAYRLRCTYRSVLIK